MKRIDAVIRPSQLDEVKARVTALGVTGLTVSEVRGFGRQKGHTETYRGSEYTVDFLPKIFVSIAVVEELVEPVVEAILEGARTGVIGDGKIFVTSLDEVIRIRTGRARAWRDLTIFRVSAERNAAFALAGTLIGIGVRKCNVHLPGGRNDGYCRRSSRSYLRKFSVVR